MKVADNIYLCISRNEGRSQYNVAELMEATHPYYSNK